MFLPSLCQHVQKLNILRQICKHRFSIYTKNTIAILIINIMFLNTFCLDFINTVLECRIFRLCPFIFLLAFGIHDCSVSRLCYSIDSCCVLLQNQVSSIASSSRSEGNLGNVELSTFKVIYPSHKEFVFIQIEVQNKIHSIIHVGDVSRLCLLIQLLFQRFLFL